MAAPRPLTIDLEGQPVRVYRNLNNGLWSVQFKGLVVAHLPEVQLAGAVFRVSAAGRARVLRERCRNVHASASGRFTAAPAPLATERVHYNPYRAAHFYVEGQPAPALSRASARFCAGGLAYASPPA